MGLRMAAAAKNAIVPSSQWGKLKTLFQIIAVTVIIFELSAVRFGLLIEGALIALAVMLTVVSGIEYFVKAWPLLTSDRT
jgi:CDP-diacylglycerol--glycerol-3-phosphate 3-phosphatidyltransferase